MFESISSRIVSANSTLASMMTPLAIGAAIGQVAHYEEVMRSMRKRGIAIPEDFIRTAISRRDIRARRYHKDRDDSIEIVGWYFNYIDRGLSDKQAMGYIKLRVDAENRWDDY